MIKRLWQEQQGNTLVEVMAASIILLIAMVPILSGITYSLNTNNSIKQNNSAYNLAFKKIEQIKLDYKNNPTPLIKTYPQEAYDINSVHYTVDTKTTIYKSGQIKNLINVSVTVTWDINKQSKSYNTIYYLLD